jgi:putative copper export protein
VLRLSLFFMVGLTIAIAVGLRWREERVAQVKPPTRGARLGWIAMQKQKVHRWFTAAALAAVVTLLFLGGINWLRVWQGQ